MVVLDIKPGNPALVPRMKGQKDRLFFQRLRMIFLSNHSSSYHVKLLVFVVILLSTVLLARRASSLVGWRRGLEEPRRDDEDQRQRYTILINTWKRNDLIKKSVEHYASCKGVDAFRIVWSEPEPPSSELHSWLLDAIAKKSRAGRHRHHLSRSAPELHFDINREDSLNNRFKPIKGLNTDAVFSVDDDVIVSCDTLEFAFKVWLSARDSMVGFVPRMHWVQSKGQTPAQTTYRYGGWWSVWWTGSYSMVLSKIAFFHRKYLELYTYEMPRSIRNYVSSERNCEDIAMSFLVANATKAPPIWVKGRVVEIGSSGISSLTGHSHRRSKCVNDFTALFGGMPLVASNVKAVDSKREWFWKRSLETPSKSVNLEDIRASGMSGSSSDDVLGPEASEMLQSWWDEVWKLEPQDIAAGKAIKMFNPRPVSILRGADKRLSSLYVRRSFEPLYDEICLEAGRAVDDWICHVNGNSGVGKSAFLWYFIIRSVMVYKGSASDVDDEAMHILYESSGFIWEFKGEKVRVVKRDMLNVNTFSKADWHLINEKVPSTGAMGPVVVLAASPKRSNIKPAKADRKKTVMYMYPWEEDEYADLVALWKSHYRTLEDELGALKDSLQSLEKWAGTTLAHKEERLRYALGRAKLADGVRVEAGVRKLLEENVKQPKEASRLAFPLQVLIKALELQVQDGLERLKAAPDYYKWFGGVVRLLWSDHTTMLTPDEFSRAVQVALKLTDLLQLLDCVQDSSQADDVSWSLLHFRKPESSTTCQSYYIDFCSGKVQAEFRAALTRTKARDLQHFMQSTSEIPQYGVLRGYVFEELSIAHILHGPPTMMVDDKHCNKCKSREGPSGSRNRGKWIACDRCEHRYHFSCARVTVRQDVRAGWECPSCDGMRSEVPLESRRLLRYYEGDLKAALLAAGADAVNYVWRPVIKNDGAVDFSLLPNTLAQPTIAERHSVPAEAVRSHVDALRAWNEVHRKSAKPTEYVLCFLLAESNYDNFGFQSYRDKSRRVAKQAVKGIRQCKVLLRHDTPLPCAEQIEIPDGVAVVDDVEKCTFEGEVSPVSYFDPDVEVFRHEEATMNKKRKYAFN